MALHSPGYKAALILVILTALIKDTSPLGKPGLDVEKGINKNKENRNIVDLHDFAD